MKKLYILLGISALVATAAAAIVFQIQYSSDRALDQKRTDWTLKEAQLQASLKELETAIEAELSNKAKMTVPQLEPTALIERFEHMQNYTNRLSREDVPLRNQWRDQMREAYFVFQGLRDSGEKSLDAIRAYLQSGHNVELMPDWITISAALHLGNKTEAVPYSSRLGLMGVLNNLNSSASLTLLCKTMFSATDPAEICYAAQALIGADREEFRSVCIKSLRQMLAANTKNNLIGYTLIQILSFLKEECGDDVTDLAAAIEFADADGNIEISLMRKKLELMGEAALPSIREAFSKTEMNLSKRMEMLMTLNEYIGINADANSMLKLMIDGSGGGSADCVGSIVVMMISDPNSYDKLSPEMIQGRLNLLNELEQSHVVGMDLLRESIGISRNLLNEFATSGVQIDSQEIMKRLAQSGYMDRLGKAMIEFTKENPEVVD